MGKMGSYTAKQSQCIIQIEINGDTTQHAKDTGEDRKRIFKISEFVKDDLKQRRQKSQYFKCHAFTIRLLLLHIHKNISVISNLLWSQNYGIINETFILI